MPGLAPQLTIAVVLYSFLAKTFLSLSLNE
jgi:hypothetical protein